MPTTDAARAPLPDSRPFESDETGLFLDREEHVDALLKRLSRVPYPGLRPFEAEEADLFFGREQHVDALLKRLSRSHFVAVVGESGSGKSSLVRAGLLPALEAGFVVGAGSDWRVAVMRPGGAPLMALADALLAPGVLISNGAAPQREFALAELRRGPLGLVQLVRDAHLAPHCNTLIVVDQFEELFRYCREPAQRDQANVFVELLLQASRYRKLPIFVVLTMRSDFVGDCARFRGLPELLNDNQYLTPRLTREQIAAAIREPARVCVEQITDSLRELPHGRDGTAEQIAAAIHERAPFGTVEQIAAAIRDAQHVRGGKVDQSLVDELCNAVEDDQDQLPLLQHLLMRVWDCAKERSNPPDVPLRLTSELSRDMGGLRSALNNHAQQVYDSLSTEQRSIARAMFKSLTDSRSQRRDLRRDAGVAEVAAIAAAQVDAVIAVADAFRAKGRHMLMPPPEVKLNGNSRLDISHESLLRQWSTLAGWAREEGANAREFDRLREAAGQGDVIIGRSLAQAQDWIRQAEPTTAWAERYAAPGELEATLTFISKSEAEAKRQMEKEQLAAKREADAKRAVRNNWILGGGLLLACLIALGVIFLWRDSEYQKVVADVARKGAEEASKDALNQKDIAEKARNEAEKATNDALAQKDAAEQAREDAERQRRSAHVSQLTAYSNLWQLQDPPLAVKLASEAVKEAGVDNAAAVEALRQAIAVHVPSVQAPFVANRGKTYIPGSGKRVWLWFSLSAASISPVENKAISPSGDSAVIWSMDAVASTKPLMHGGSVVGSAGFSPNGRLAVTTGADHYANTNIGPNNFAKVWEVSTGKLIGSLRHSEAVNGAVFSPDGTLLVTLGDDSLGQLWNVDNLMGSPRCELRRPGNFLFASFSSDQRLLVTGNNGWAEVWDLTRAGCPRIPVRGLAGIEGVRWASFSNHGAWLGVVTAKGEATVLRVPNDLGAADWQQQRKFTPSVVFGSGNDEGDNNAESFPPPLAWSQDPKGRFFAAAGGDNRIYIVDLESPANDPIALPGRHEGRVTSIAFSAAGNTLASTSTDGTVRTWKFGADQRVIERLVLTGKGAIGSGAFSPKGDRIITASEDGTVRSWELPSALQETPYSGVSAAWYSADGKQIGVSGMNTAPQTGRVEGFRVSELTADTLTARGDARNTSSGSNITFHGPIVVESDESGIKVHDQRARAPARLLAESKDFFRSAPSVSPRGRYLFARVATNNVARLWDLTTQGRPEQVSLPPAMTNQSCSAPVPPVVSDDRRVAWYCPGSDRVFIAGPGQTRLVEIPIDDETTVQSMRFSTSGALLALAFEGFSVQIFDSRTGAARHPPMKGHSARIRSMDFSRDDSMLLSVGNDSTARVWDVGSGTQAGSTEIGAQFAGAAFSPDGVSALLFALDRRLPSVRSASGGLVPGGFAPGRLLIWRCHSCGGTEQLQEEVAKRNVDRDRPLSAEEKKKYGLP